MIGRRRVNTVILTLCLLGWLIPPSTSKSAGDLKPNAKQEELKVIGKQLQQAVLTKDIKLLLAYDSKGEKIGGIVYDAYSQDERELLDQNSELYCYLFDTRCLKEIGANASGQNNPFLQTSIRDFLKMQKDVQIEVFVWPKAAAQLLDVASVIYVTPHFRANLLSIKNKDGDWPYDKWAKEFVACDFVYTEHGWRYAYGILKVAVSEEGLG